MKPELSFYGVKHVTAKAVGTYGAPLDLVLSDGKQSFELTIYTDDHALTNRLMAAINQAAETALLVAAE